MLTDNLEITDFTSWVGGSSTIPSGIGDPFTSSMRSFVRALSALAGTAQSRATQQRTDLRSMKLKRSDGNNTPLGNSFLLRANQFGATNSETCAALILLYEAQLHVVRYYLDIIAFWANIASKVGGFSVLRGNLTQSFLITRLSVEKNGFCPLRELYSDLTQISFTQELTYTDLENRLTNPTLLQPLERNINGWLIRNRFDSFFKALEILLSNQKNNTLQQLLAGNDLSIAKQIISFYMSQLPLNTILYGPPGTGKTHSVKTWALALIKGISVQQAELLPDINGEFETLRDAGQIAFVTFHQSYSYEDFVEGLRPKLNSERIEYELRPGIFKIMCDRAAGVTTEARFVLIIDEINRGNISNIFGELITLIEPSRRIGASDELRVRLAYSDQEDFGVLSNLYLLGTMNSTDRSIAILDTALRRRFSFEEYLPDADILPDVVIDGTTVSLKNLLSVVNERIEILLDKDHTIGHSYFLGVTDKSSLARVVIKKIIPLVKEFFYNDYEKIRFVFGDSNTSKTVEQQIFKEKILPQTANLGGSGIDGYADKKYYELNPALVVDDYDTIPVELFTKIYEP